MDKRLENYKEYLYQQELAASTISVYVRIIRRFLEYTKSGELNKLQVIAFKEHISQKDFAVTTINLYIIAVNRYLTYCGYGECRIKTKKCQKRRSVDNVLNEMEYSAMLDYALVAGNFKYYAIMKTFALTGIRVGELKFITAENFREGHIVVNNKGKNREIFLPDSLILVLQQYCRRCHVKSGSVFIGSTGKPISRVAVWKGINHVAQKAGIDKRKAHPHSFRHYFALLYMKYYSNLFELADILGHASLETTRIYAAATVEDKRHRMEALDVKVNEIQYFSNDVK